MSKGGIQDYVHGFRGRMSQTASTGAAPSASPSLSGSGTPSPAQAPAESAWPGRRSAWPPSSTSAPARSTAATGWPAYPQSAAPAGPWAGDHCAARPPDPPPPPLDSGATRGAPPHMDCRDLGRRVAAVREQHHLRPQGHPAHRLAAHLLHLAPLVIRQMQTDHRQFLLRPHRARTVPDL